MAEPKTRMEWVQRANALSSRANASGKKEDHEAAAAAHKHAGSTFSAQLHEKQAKRAGPGIGVGGDVGKALSKNPRAKKPKATPEEAMAKMQARIDKARAGQDAARTATAASKARTSALKDETARVKTSAADAGEAGAGLRAKAAGLEKQIADTHAETKRIDRGLAREDREADRTIPKKPRASKLSGDPLADLKRTKFAANRAGLADIVAQKSAKTHAKIGQHGPLQPSPFEGGQHPERPTIRVPAGAMEAGYKAAVQGAASRNAAAAGKPKHQPAPDDRATVPPPGGAKPIGKQSLLPGAHRNDGVGGEGSGREEKLRQQAAHAGSPEDHATGGKALAQHGQEGHEKLARAYTELQEAHGLRGRSEADPAVQGSHKREAAEAAEEGMRHQEHAGAGRKDATHHLRLSADEHHDQAEHHTVKSDAHRDKAAKSHGELQRAHFSVAHAHDHMADHHQAAGNRISVRQAQEESVTEAQRNTRGAGRTPRGRPEDRKIIQGKRGGQYVMTARGTRVYIRRGGR